MTTHGPATVTGGAGAAPKIGSIAGIAFVVLFLLGFLLVSTPEADASDAKWLAYWQDSGHRTAGILASLAVLLSAVGFLWLVGAIRRRLPVDAVGADAAYAGGIAYGAVLLMAGFGRGVIPVGKSLVVVPIPQNADLLRLADGMYFGVIFLVLPYAIAAFLIPLFFALRGSTVLPGWVGIYGLVVGIIALSGPFLFVVPHILFLIWVLIVSVLLLTRGSTASAVG
jgi:hypothetical protein